MGTFFIEQGVALPRFTEGRFPYNTSPEYFASVAVGITHWSAKLRGCGTRREHIGTLANALASTSGRQAEFLHNEAPEILIPAPVRETLILK